MVETSITSEMVLSVQRDIAHEYPDTTIPGDVKHKPGFIDYITTHTDNWDELAIKLLQNIARTHPFPDGNKRTAVNIAGTVCIETGYEINAEHFRELVLEVARSEDNDMDDAIDTLRSIAEKTNEYKDCESPYEMATQYRHNNSDVFDRLAHE